MVKLTTDVLQFIAIYKKTYKQHKNKEVAPVSSSVKKTTHH